MKTNRNIVRFSQTVFRIQEKIITTLNKQLENIVEKEKRNYYKMYGEEPKKIDIKEIKKSIVMKYGLITFTLFVTITFIFFT